MLSDKERAFLTRRRIGRLATAGHSGKPHLVPVCFALHEQAIYTAIDEKPKSGHVLTRVRNIAENPNVAFLVDHYEDDWSRLGWLRIDGAAELVSDGSERDHAIGLLCERYAQYESMHLAAIIAIRIRHVRSWGNLET
jgi:PPOX class probable F420-dependent enzyme